MMKFFTITSPFSNNFNHCAQWWSNGQQLFEILSRRIIERQWIPTIHPKYIFHVCRQEKFQLVLEKFIPFDFSNQAIKIIKKIIIKKI